jgi:hypothetical protein
MITCVVEYVIDPAEIDAFERFGRRWIELVNQHGFPSLAAYEQYRTLFGTDPDFIEADREPTTSPLRSAAAPERPAGPGELGVDDGLSRTHDRVIRRNGVSHAQGNAGSGCRRGDGLQRRASDGCLRYERPGAGVQGRAEFSRHLRVRLLRDQQGRVVVHHRI